MSKTVYPRQARLETVQGKNRKVRKKERDARKNDLVIESNAAELPMTQCFV